jgi:hypothetical protein
VLVRHARDEGVVVVILAIGVAVSQQDDLAHVDVALQNLALRNLQGFLEVGAAARLQPVDARLELAALVAERLQVAKHVGLGIERDHAGVVGVVELPQERDRRLLSVADSLAVAHRGIARVVAHRVGSIDAQVDGDRLARGRRRLWLEFDRQRLLQIAAAITAVAKGVAGRDESAAEIRDVMLESVLHAGRERGGRHFIEYHHLVGQIIGGF